MKNKHLGKRCLSTFLALVMLLSMLPAQVFATDAEPCTHHTEHTAACGYVEAVEGVPCGHSHDDSCGYVEAVAGISCDCAADENGVIAHVEGCGYVAPVEGSDCTHAHDETCGYVAAVEGVACTFECEECAAEAEEKAAAEKAAAEQAAADAAAVAEVQAMIDALDTEVSSDEEAKALEEAIAAVEDAMVELGDEKCALLDLTKYEAAADAVDAYWEQDYSQETLEDTWYDAEATELVVDSVEDLLAFAAAVNAGNNFAGKVVKLGAGIDLSGIEWAPIGGDSVYFAGEFDGGGYIISNLTQTTGARMGLFGMVEKAYIHDLTMEKVSFTIAADNSRVGAIAGNLQYWNVLEDITIDGITITANGNDGLIGAVAGYVWKSQMGNVDVKNAVITVNGTGNVLGGNTGYGRAHVWDNNVTGNNDNWLPGTVQNIDNTDDGVDNPVERVLQNYWEECDVDNIEIELNGTGSEVGGFFGSDTYNSHSNYFVDCHVTDLDVTAAEGTSQIVGGFIAWNNGTTAAGTVNGFDGCSATGTITGANGTYGGFSGQVGGRACSYNGASADVDITCTGTAGGFVGATQAYSTHAYTFTDCTAKGDVSAAVAGGFAGKSGMSGDGKNVFVTYDGCSASGTVKGIDIAGGLIGEVNTELPATNWNTVDGTGALNLTGNTAATNVIGGNHTGALIGYLDGVANGDAKEGNSLEVTLTDNIPASGVNTSEDTPAEDIVVVKNVAETGESKYSTLAKAVEAAEAGATITILEDHNVGTPIVIEKNVTIDLNGCTITGNDVYPVIRVQGGANVTVTGKGGITNANDYVFVLGASDSSSAGNLTIEDGKYVGCTTVASVTKGTLTINGGEFEETSGTATYLLNCIDANYTAGTAKIIVKGGSFKGFNPADNEAETGDHISFVPYGYAATDVDGKYSVAKMEYIAINNMDDLKAIAAKAQAGETFKALTVKLCADIDMAGTKWLEIDKDGNVVSDFRIPNFAGTFDGQNHTISNVVYDVAQSGNHRAMMFSGTLTGVVKNLKVEDVSATIAGGTTRVAAVANTITGSDSTNARLENVHVKNFTINSNNGLTDQTWFGGLSVYTSGGHLAIDDCSVTNFQLTANSTYMASAVSSCITPNNDFKDTTVTGFTANIKQVNGVLGGFAGQTQSGGTNASFTNCHVTGLDFNIETIGSNSDNIGGFMATIGGATQFYNCSTQGIINITNDTLTNKSVGGFIGDHGWNGMYGPDREHEFYNCVADVDITAVSANVGGFIGNSTIAGHPYRHIPAYFYDCAAKGDVATTNGSAGGFVGTGDRGIFEGCSASGDVTGYIAGGFWGNIYPKTKAESMGNTTHSDPNSKSIILEGCSASGSVTGTTYAAGLIGFVKDVYVDAEGNMGYATPVKLTGNIPADTVSGETTAVDYNRYSYGSEVTPIEKTYATLSFDRLQTNNNYQWPTQTFVYGSESDYDSLQAMIGGTAADATLGGMTLLAQAAGDNQITNAVLTLHADLDEAIVLPALYGDVETHYSLTIDLNGFELSGGAAKKTIETYVDTTIKNGTIESLNRCVDTRTAVELTLTDVDLIADQYNSTYGNPQPLTIGGSEDGTKVTMTDVDIDAGKSGYGIITFVETELTATDSDIGGYSALYVKPGSEESTFNFVNSDLSGSTANNDVEGNSFSTIAVRANDVTVNVDEDSTVTAGGDYCCAISLGGAYTGEESVTGAKVTVVGTIDGNVLSAKNLTDNTVTVKETYVAQVEKDGYKTQDNGDGTVTVIDYVQWIKQQLLAGNNVTLDRDVVVDGSYIETVPHAVNSNGYYPNWGIFTVVGDHDVTVDLNGFDVTYNGHADFKYNATYGKPANGSANSCTVAHGLFFANGGADLTIMDSKGTSDVTVYGLASGAYVATPNTTLTIKGGTWKNEGCATCGGTNIFLYPLQGGELYIEDGYFEQALDSNGDSYLIVEHGGSMSNSVIDYSKTKVEISGGTFVGMNPSEIKYFYQGSSDSDPSDLTGGVKTNGCAQGYTPEVNSEGQWTVEPAMIFKMHYVDPTTGEPAWISPLSGNDLAEIVKNGKAFYANYYEMTLEVGGDFEIDEPVVIDYPMTIDLGGNTLTSDAVPAIRITNGADVTVKNGTMDTDSYCFILGASDGSSAGNLTIESGKYHGATTVASVTKGTLTIKDGEFSVDPYNGSYEFLLNCIDGNYKDGSAKIEVKGGTFYNFNPESNAAEGANTNFMHEDYTAVAGDNTTWTVKQSTVHIKSAEDLVAFSNAIGNAVSSGGLYQGIEVHNNPALTVKLDADIDMSGVTGFWPIGSGDAKREFAGTFDGQNHTISNLYCDNNWSYRNGFFRTLSRDTTIKDLTFDNAFIGRGAGTKNNSNYAVVVGITGGGNILLDNVTVTNSTVEARTSAGILIGRINGGDIAIQNCTVDNCTLIVDSIYCAALTGYVESDDYSDYNDALNNTVKDSVMIVDGEVKVMPKHTHEATQEYTESTYVAQIGDTKYATLYDAVQAAVSGNVITLVDDVVRAETLVVNKAVTLDLNDKTVSAATALKNGPVFRILADVTVKNGTVDGTTGINSYAFIVGNSETAGTLNIADGTYKGVTSVISITNGTANISGGNFSTGHDNEGTDYGTQYLLNCMDAAYKAGTAVYNITGGTFVGFNPADNAAEGANTNFVADGYKAVDNGDDTWTVKKNDPVAQIGDETFDSLQAAYDAAANDATIVLLKDIVLTETFKADENKAVYIKAEALNISGDLATLIEVSAGTVRFSSRGEIENTGDVLFANGGKVIVYGPAKITSENSNCVYLRGGSVGLQKAILTANGEYPAIQGNGNYTGDVSIQGGSVSAPNTDMAIYWPQNGNLTISGGTITGDTAVYAKSGKITISGGELIADGAKADFAHNSNGANATGDALVIEACSDSAYELPVVSITGGTLTSANAKPVGYYQCNGTKLADEQFITGGTFSSYVSSTICEDGYLATMLKDGTKMWTLKQADAVASIGDNQFATMQDAAETAVNGDVIEVLKSIENSPMFMKAKTVTIDFNGYSYVQTQTGSYDVYGDRSTWMMVSDRGYIHTIDGGAVTVKDAVLKSEVGPIFWSASALKLENCVCETTVEGKPIVNAKNQYVLGGELEIIGGEYTVAKNTMPAWLGFFADNTYDCITIDNGWFNLSVQDWIEAKNAKGFTYGQYGRIMNDVKGYVVTQDAPAAQIGDVKYLTVQDAIDYAQAGETVKVLESHEIAETVMVNKAVTLDLNGMTVSAAAELKNAPVFRILSDVTVTNGTVDGTPGTSSYAFIVGNSETAGTLTITDGTYMGDVSVASVTKGTLTIEGGEFSATEYNGAHEFTLNCIDASYNDGSAKIVVKGGTFKNFNPANNAAEGANTNFVADGYKAVDNGDGTWTVKKAAGIQLRSATLNLQDMVAIIYKAADAATADNTDVAERGVLLFKTKELAATKDPAKAYETIVLEYNAEEQRYIGQSEGIDARDMDQSQFAVAYMKMVDGTYIFSTLNNGNDQIVEYSPLIYCKNMKNNAVVGKLCCALMQYGAAAQVAQYGMTTGLMNEGFEDIPYDASVLGESVFSVQQGWINGIMLSAATMNLQGAVSYIVKFKADDAVAGKQLYAEYTLLGETKSVELEPSPDNDGRLWAVISGVPAKDLGATLTVKAYCLDDNGEKVYGGELVYSGYEYIRRAQNNNYTEADKALSRALAMYIHYADIYGN